MATLQVVNVKDMSGNAKATGRPYKMRIVKGVLTTDDGVMDTGELVFMENEKRPLPAVAPGQKYTLVSYLYVNRDGKISSGIEDLKLVKAQVAAAA